MLSVAFLSMQLLYQPFRSRACNILQQACLTALCLVYFAGLLLKLAVVEAADEDALGVLLVLLLGLTFCTVAFGAWWEVLHVWRAVRRARHCGGVLRMLPRSDPPPDSDEFYLIQNPVEEGNVGDAFVAKLPHLLSHFTDGQKLAVVRVLTAENEGRLGRFFERVGSGAESRAPLDVVKKAGIVQLCNKHTSLAVCCTAAVRLRNTAAVGIQYVCSTQRAP
jgi:hypothetical protein